jgi:hypothetical protein
VHPRLRRVVKGVALVSKDCRVVEVGAKSRDGTIILSVLVALAATSSLLRCYIFVLSHLLQ